MIGKLIAVQTALKAPKGQYNSFGKYSYRSCEDILEAAKPLLMENGLLLTLTDEPVMVGERTYIKATASVTDGDKSVSATAYAREENEKKGMDGSQVTGTASSYARKYALNGLFLIDDTKDADTMDNRPAQKPARKPAKDEKKAAGDAAREAAKERLWSAIRAYCRRNGTDANAEIEELGGRDALAAKDAKWLNLKAEYYEAN